MSPETPLQAFPAQDPLPDEAGFRGALRRASLGLTLALLLPALALLGLVLYQRNAAWWVDHTDLVIEKVYALEQLMWDLSSGMRGYQITGQTSLLNPYRDALPQLDAKLDEIAALVADDPAQVAAAEALRGDLRAWRGYAEETLRRPDAGTDEARAPEAYLRGRQLIFAARARAQAFIATETSLRAQRQQRLDRIVNGLFAFLGIVALGGIPLINAWQRRTLRRSVTSYRASLADSKRLTRELQVTLSSIGDAVIATDAGGTVTFVNPVAERLTGWTSAEARGRPFPEVLPIFNEQTGEPAENPVERVLREGVVVGLANHTVLRPRSGGEIPIEDSAAPIHADGSLLGVILVFRDVTEKHRGDRALRSSESRARAILDTSLDAVLLMDADGKIAAWNPAAERIFGWRREEVIGGELADHIIPERLRGAHRRGLAHYLASGEGPVLGKQLELPAVRRDGEEFPVEISINPLPGDERGLFVGFVRDISQRKAIEADLRAAKDAAEAASRAKDEFLAALSHELRTPLTPVLMTAAALREDERLPADAREQLGMMERNIALEARLIDDLLDLTRIAQGKLPLRPQPCDAHSLINLAVEIVRDEAQAKGIALQRDFAAGRAGLQADPARLQQVVWNLLRNAVKFTPRGGRVTIRTSNPAADGKGGAERLRIEIDDSGIGIAAGELERIFHAFEQGTELAGEHRFGGLGLGLSIARAIVDLHGGTIRAESAGRGEGATFVVELPDAVLVSPGASERLLQPMRPR